MPEVLSKAKNTWFVYDYIGDETNARSIAEFLDEADGKQVLLTINSPGGDVFEGIAIYNLLKNSKSRVKVEIVGLAASSASVIAMAGNDVVMSETAMLMIHNPFTVEIGDANDMKKTADVLEKIENSLVTIYSKKTGLPEEKIKQMMDDETWISAEQALKDGFIDRIIKIDNVVWNCNGIEKFKYKNIPKQILTQQRNEEMLDQIRNLLGVENDEQIIEALTGKLALAETVESQKDELKKVQAEFGKAQKKIEEMKKVSGGNATQIDEYKAQIDRANEIIEEHKAKIAAHEKAQKLFEAQIKDIQAEREAIKVAGIKAEIESLKKDGYLNPAMGESLFAVFEASGQKAYDLARDAIKAGGPQKAHLTASQGSGGDSAPEIDDPVAKLEAEIKALMKAESLDYSAATERLLQEKPELFEAYNDAVTNLGE